jgi:hypothetical protein
VSSVLRRIEAAFIDPAPELVFFDRQAWREMDLEFVVVPVLDGPVLVFPPARQQEANVAQWDLEQLAEQWHRFPDRRGALAERIRKLHHKRVNLAEGYHPWAGTTVRVMFDA